jgi:hypothetical protein
MPIFFGPAFFRGGLSTLRWRAGERAPFGGSGKRGYEKLSLYGGCTEVASRRFSLNASFSARSSRAIEGLKARPGKMRVQKKLACPLFTLVSGFFRPYFIAVHRVAAGVAGIGDIEEKGTTVVLVRASERLSREW